MSPGIAGRTDAPTCVLFDFDGTLIDSLPALVGAYQQAFLEVLGHTVPELESDPASFLTPRVAEVCRAVAGPRAEECAVAYDRHYRASTYRLASAYPGVLDMVATLQERGVAAGIVTNKGRARTLRDLEWIGLAPEQLATVVCSEDTLLRKPDGAPVALGIDLAGGIPERTVYVGDGPQDARAARAAGAASIGVLYGYYPEADLREAGPDVVVSTPEALVELLLELTA